MLIISRQTGKNEKYLTQAKYLSGGRLAKGNNFYKK